jgi:adenine specific DNA methylase Mod
MRTLKRNNKFYDTARFGQPEIRVYHKAGKGKRSPRYLLKCGCCDEKLEIHYAEDGLEIGGVNGAIEDWREILLPLLRIEEKERHR